MSFVQTTRRKITFFPVQTCFVIRQLSLDNATTLEHAEFRERAKTAPLGNLHAHLVCFFRSPSVNGTSRIICLGTSTMFEVRFLKANNTRRIAA